MLQPDPPPNALRLDDCQTDFDSLLAAAQPRLRGYIAAILIGMGSDVDDLVQETNMVLWHKREHFSVGTSFIAWAFRVAYFKATTWRRDRLREGRVFFSEEAFPQIAALAQEHFTNRPGIDDALEDCMGKLPTKDRELVQIKYGERKSLVDHAEATGDSAQTVRKRLSRIRLVLRKCVDQQLSGNFKETYEHS
ncbi:MAG TPA: sigma-70 family RNA polymerase sigma factor [Luteolibacter sp.]